MVTVLPTVFCIDLDGTIIGDCSYQSQIHVVNGVLKQAGFKIQKRNHIPSAYFPNNRLVRQGLANFMKAVHQMYEGRVYFFVFTASERSWANQQISWIEKTHDVKFSRPVFTRDDCHVDQGGNIKKSIAKIWPRLCRAMPSMSPKERMYVLEHQFMIIDNNAVYVDHMDKLLLCPTYGYAAIENLLSAIPSNARKHPSVDRLILGFINQGILCPYVETSGNAKEEDGMRRLSKQYNWLAKKCDSMANTNRKYTHDKFWSILRKLLIANNIRNYSPSTILQLQNTVWKTMGVKA